jgi:hypothetical protein
MVEILAEKGGSRTLREPYGPQTGFEDQRHHRAPSFSTLINQPPTAAALVVLDSLGKPGNNRTRLPRQFLDIYLSRGHLPLLMSGCLHRYFSRYTALCP